MQTQCLIKRYECACLVWLVLTATGLYAQDLTFYGGLLALNHTGRVAHKFDLNFFASTTVDAFTRRIQGVEYPARDLQLYIQPSIVYRHSGNLSFSGSYTYQRNNPLEPTFVNEHRLWEQVLVGHSLAKGRLTHRFRYEQRFIQDRALNQFPFSTRLRYQVALSVPLQGPTLEGNECYLAAYNEFYFSLSGQRNALYSENWAYLGVGRTFKNNSRLEMGYLFQSARRNLNHDNRYLHLLQVMWITNFSLQKRGSQATT
jgi:hypothetical protein